MTTTMTIEQARQMGPHIVVCCIVLLYMLLLAGLSLVGRVILWPGTLECVMWFPFLRHDIQRVEL